MLDAYPIPHSPPSNNGQPLIRLEKVNKLFKLGAGDFLALKEINLYFRQGNYAPSWANPAAANPP